MADNVNHPPHYTRGGIETIDFIEAKGLSWCLGNVVKYISRAGLKGDALEDLRKAAWYLAREIKRLGGGVGDDASDAIRQRDKQIADLTWQYETERKQANEWNDRACKLQDERDIAIAERDVARQLAGGNFDELTEVQQDFEAARNQIAELAWQCEAARKQADEWKKKASEMQNEIDAARTKIAELTRQRDIGVSRGPDGWYEAACRMQDERDAARKQVVELTKRLVDAGLLQSTEAQ